MCNDYLTPEIRNYVSELMKRKAIGADSLLDQMLMNHLCNQRIDLDYFLIRYPVKPAYAESSASL